MRVPVDDGVATGKRRGEPLAAPNARARVVHQPDPSVGDLYNPTFGQSCEELGLVHVSSDRLDRCEPAKILEHRPRDNVACVEDQRRALQPPEACAWEPPRPPRHVRVGDDGDLQRVGSAGAVEERSVAVHELAVSVDLPTLPQVADHVPVQCGDVLAARAGNRPAEREMDGTADLLVE
jgi:hypothetical protein